MARKVTVTKAEQDAIECSIRVLGQFIDSDKLCRRAQSVLVSLLAKLEAPAEVKMAGMSLLAFERALGDCPKYARWIAGNPGRWLKALHQAGATEEQVATVGKWLTAQDWMRGRVTLGSIATNWGGWLARATSETKTATRPVAGRPAGFAE